MVVGGWVADPEFDLPVTFTISVTNPGAATQTSGPILARDVRLDGNWPLPSRTHGFNVAVPIAAASGATVCLNARGYGSSAGSTTQIACRSV